MKNVTFYILDRNNISCNLNSIGQLVCDIIIKYWRKDKRVLILCEGKLQAYFFDKILWEKSSDSFIPHNLTGEGPKKGAPIEITWPQKYVFYPMYDILINLNIKSNGSLTFYKEVIDFVPYEKSLRKLARVRYKAYRLAGFKLNTIIWNDEKNIQSI